MTQEEQLVKAAQHLCLMWDYFQNGMTDHKHVNDAMTECNEILAAYVVKSAAPFRSTCPACPPNKEHNAGRLT